LLAVDESQPSATATEGSDNSGLQKMLKSHYRADARNFTDFFIAYATVPGYCDMHNQCFFVKQYFPVRVF